MLQFSNNFSSFHFYLCRIFLIKSNSKFLPSVVQGSDSSYSKIKLRDRNRVRKELNPEICLQHRLNASSLRFWKTIHDGIDFFFIKCIDKRFREPAHAFPRHLLLSFLVSGNNKTRHSISKLGKRERDDPSKRILSRLLVTFGSTNFGRREEMTRERERDSSRRLPQEFRILSFWSFLERERKREKEIKRETARGKTKRADKGPNLFLEFLLLRSSFSVSAFAFSFAPQAHDLFSLVPRDTCCPVTRGRAYISRSSRVHARMSYTPDTGRLLSPDVIILRSLRQDAKCRLAKLSWNFGSNEIVSSASSIVFRPLNLIWIVGKKKWETFPLERRFVSLPR